MCLLQRGANAAQEDLRMLKDKLKRKQAVIDRQEEDLRARERSLKDAENVAKIESKSSVDMREELLACKVAQFVKSHLLSENGRRGRNLPELILLPAKVEDFLSHGSSSCGSVIWRVALNTLSLKQEENTALREKLEECTKQLQSNGQMIRWLNEQVIVRSVTY